MRYIDVSVNFLLIFNNIGYECFLGDVFFVCSLELIGIVCKYIFVYMRVVFDWFGFCVGDMFVVNGPKMVFVIFEF